VLALEDRTAPAIATWTGAGLTDFWTDGRNWQLGKAPGPGDDLVFPAVALQKDNQNDFQSIIQFNSISVSDGYTLNGNDVDLASGLRINPDFGNTGVSTINLAVFAIGSAIIDFPLPDGTLILTPSGPNVFVGGITVVDGTLQGTTLGILGNVVNDSTVVFDQPVSGFFSGSISGSGRLIKRGIGDVAFGSATATLTYTGPTLIEAGALVTFGDDVLPDATAVTVTAPGVYDTRGYSDVIGSLAGDGIVVMSEDTRGATLTTGADNSTTVFSGTFQNGPQSFQPNQLVKLGTGTFTISGQGFATPTTEIIADAGPLLITGTAPVNVVLDGGFLGGTGAVAAVVAGSGGGFSPGIGTGIFTVGIGGSLTPVPPSFFNTTTFFSAELAGTLAGSGYDQLAVVSNVGLNLGGANLQLLPRFTAAKGDVFDIIVAPTGRIAGTFANLPEGATVTAFDGQQFTISYAAAPTPSQQAVRLLALGPPTPPPQPTRLLAVGAGASGSPIVNVYNADGSARFSFLAYDAGFRGGVRVATGDVNGDFFDDIITAAGPTGGPHVRIFDGRTGAAIVDFYAYDSSFTGGVFVAAGDVDGDGIAEVITGAGSCGGPHVKVFTFPQRVAVLREFFAYDPAFTGGVRVAAGDIDRDGFADIVTGAGPCGGPHVQVFSGFDNSRLQSFYAYDPAYNGGVFVAAGDVDGDGRADVITGTDVGGEPQVRIFSGGAAAAARDFFAFESAFLGGVRVTADDLNGDGVAELTVGAGANGGSRVRTLDGRTGTQIRAFSAFDARFTGSVYVG